MLKIIAFTKRKTGLSLEEFKRYYERRHAKLCRELNPHIQAYTRNFIDHGSLMSAPAVNAGASSELDFDCVTEMYFKDRATFEASMAETMRPENLRRIEQDEANFQDRSKTRMFIVDERES